MTTSAHNYRTASVGLRFFAFLIDSILLVAVISIFLFKSMGPIPSDKQTSSEGQTSIADKYELFAYGDSLRDPSLWKSTVPSMFRRFPVAMLIGLLLLPFLYYSIFEGIWGGTIGKLITGIRVRRKDGGKLNYATAIIRSIGKLISTNILLLGCILALFDRKRQSLHDKIANTMVLKIN